MNGYLKLGIIFVEFCIIVLICSLIIVYKIPNEPVYVLIGLIVSMVITASICAATYRLLPNSEDDE